MYSFRSIIAAFALAFLFTAQVYVGLARCHRSRKQLTQVPGTIFKLHGNECVYELEC